MQGTKWEQDGVRVVKNDELDTNLPQVPGIKRSAAITFERFGARRIRVGHAVLRSALCPAPGDQCLGHGAVGDRVDIPERTKK